MNIDLTESNTTTNYTFRIEHDNKSYLATVYLNESGKFIDDNVRHIFGEELGYEGEEGQLREDILTQIDKDWHKLVG